MSHNVQGFFKEIGNKLYSGSANHKEQGGKRQNISMSEKIRIFCKQIINSQYKLQKIKLDKILLFVETIRSESNAIQRPGFF